MNRKQNPVHAHSQDPEWINTWKEETDKTQLQLSGRIFILKFLELLKRQPRNIKREYMGKVLHAVFFFGRLNKRQTEPNEFLDTETFKRMKKMCKLPFQQYSTHLPSLTPYSILLQFGSEVAGCSTQKEMESFLCEFNRAVGDAVKEVQELTISNFIFRAAVVAYSFYREPKTPQNEADLRLFYGASLSCRGRMEKSIMIKILCLRTWHKAVAFAVHHGNDPLAIVFPDGVECRAFCYSKGNFIEKPPCVKCKEMYDVKFQPHGDDNKEDTEWPYGNCAENECLSKLLHGVPGLQEKVVSTDNPPANTYKDIEREFAKNIEQSITSKLTELLHNKRFPCDNLQFFEP